MLFAVQLQLLPVSGRIGYAAEVPPITHLLLIDTLLAGRLDSFVEALAHILLPAITLALPSILRERPSGSPGDSDIFGAQQHAPLLDIEVPIESDR
jgi:hypothetical protein